MDSVALIVRAALFVVFATAGAAKLADLQGSRDTVTAFGVPDGLARVIGTALPVAELLTALALLPTVTARWGAVAAAALLVVFNGGVAYALSQGRTPDCNCFGQVSSEQISSRTLLRNAGLILLAGFSIWRGAGSSLGRWSTNLTASNLVAAIALLLLALSAVAIFTLRGLLAEARRDLVGPAQRSAKPGLQPGVGAPLFELPVLGGSTASLSELLDRGIPTVLVFASQTCAPCAQMLPELVRWSETLEERLAFALVESSVPDPEALMDEIARHGTILTLVDEGRLVAAAYQAEATPSAVVVGADGRIAANQVVGAGNIEGLVRSMLENPAGQRSVAV